VSVSSVQRFETEFTSIPGSSKSSKSVNGFDMYLPSTLSTRDSVSIEDDTWMEEVES
jgi:hypothetical protein